MTDPAEIIKDEPVTESFSIPNLFAAGSLSALAAVPAAILLMISLLVFGAKLDHVSWATLAAMLALVPVGAFGGVLVYALPVILILNHLGRLTPVALGITAALAGPLASMLLGDFRPQLIVLISYHALVVAAAFWQIINRMPKRRRRGSGYLAPL